jgi:hypothetical protein
MISIAIIIAAIFTVVLFGVSYAYRDEYRESADELLIAADQTIRGRSTTQTADAADKLLIAAERAVRRRRATPTAAARYRIIMQIAISIIIVVAALWALLSGGVHDTHWASGLLGTVVGFWLKR